jgi:hypothetical protein
VQATRFWIRECRKKKTLFVCYRQEHVNFQVIQREDWKIDWLMSSSQQCCIAYSWLLTHNIIKTKY